MKRLRLRKIIAKIKKDPDCWNQYHWHCGTAHCIAGHCQIGAGKYDSETYNVDLYDDRMKVRSDAKEYLGLNREQTSYLFCMDITLRQIIRFEKTNGAVPRGW